MKCLYCNSEIGEKLNKKYCYEQVKEHINRNDVQIHSRI